MGDKEEPMEEDWEYFDDNVVLPDFWQKYMSENLDTKNPLPGWLHYYTKPYEHQYGWNMYREFWRIWVPILLAPKNGTTSVDHLSDVDERRINDILITPLEKFICGGEQVDEVFRTLAANDSPSSICGHVFKAGETCYSCRDCGQDATCVMCVTCFTNSSHKEHKYKMAVSDGGGFCDCGDEEAFTADPTCSVHAPKDDEVVTNKQIMDQFPEDLKNRARDLLYNICAYCIGVISDAKGQDDLVPGGKEKETFDDLKFPFKYSNYCTVLLNDENHSYQDVIRVLTKVLPKVTSKTCTDLTTYVDKHGKAVIKVGNYPDCEVISKRIEGLTRITYTQVLKSKVMNSYIVAHQAYVSRLLKWIPTLFERSSGFRAIFSEVVFMDSPETNVTVKRHNLNGGGTSNKKYSICEAILLNDVNSWKEVRSLWLSLVINGLMKDYESKKELATIFTKAYPTILADFVSDDQEKDSSIMTLSVQIFTVPSLSCHLIEKCDGLSNLMEGFVDLISGQLGDEGKLILSSWADEEKSEFSRGLHGLYDITYLLSVVPSEDTWNDKLRSSFNKGLKKILEVLSMMQGMDSMRRQVGSHVEMEDNVWKNAYELQSYFGDIIRLVVNWAVSDRAVLLHAIRATIQMIASCHERTGVKETTKHLAFLGPPKTYEVVDFSVDSQSVSVHAPLHRFLANLMAEVSRYDLEVNLKQRIENEISLQHLIEPILQVAVTVSQIEIGMWRRNGSTAEGQAYIYLSKKYCPGLKEADLLLLQLTASMVDNMDDFLVWILARFNLTKFVTGELENETRVVEEMVDFKNGLAEDWLSLIIAMISERSSSNVGSGASVRAAVREEVIHMLCIEPMPHSVLVKRLPERKDMDKIVDEVISEVAELKASSKTAGKKVYHLRSGLEKEYNMFYHGYNKEQQSAAQEAQLSMRRSKGDCCPPPQLKPLSKLFSGLVRIAQSQVTLQACVVTLRRITSKGVASKYVTEAGVHKVLFLLALGLREAKRPGYEFLEKAEKAGIWDFVEKLVKEEPRDLPEHVKMLAGWVKNTSDEMRRKIKGEPMAVEENENNQEEISNAEIARKKKAEAAAARKAKIMAQMTAMQKNFAAENAAMLDGMEENNTPEVSETSVKSTVRETVCLGPQQSPRQEAGKRYTCILCQEEGKVGSGPAMVMAAYLQKSTVLSHRPAWDGSAPMSAPQVSPHHLSATRDCGPHMSTCGHAMHASCYQKFYDALVIKERDRNISMITRSLNFDVNSYEFLCPICERLSNTVLPVIPSVSHLRKKQTASSASASEIGLNSWIKALKSSVESWYLQDHSLEEPTLPRMSLKTSMEEQAAQHGKQFAACFQPAGDCDGSPVENDLYEMMNVFSIAAFTTSLDLNPHEEDYRVPLVSLQAAAFTIEGMERMLELEDRPLFGGLNTRDEDLLRYVSRFIATFASSYSKPPGSSNMRDLVKKIKGFYRLKSLQSNAIFLLASLLADNNPMGSAHFKLDSFGMLVSLIISLPCIFDSDHPPRLPSGQGMELYCLKLCLMQHIIQVLLNTSSQKYQEMSDSSPRPSNPDDLILKLLTCAVNKSDLNIDLKKINTNKVLSYLESAILPFLRCSALLFSNFTDVPPGMDIVEDGGRSYTPLARYLGLPPLLATFLDSPPTVTMAEFIYINKQPPVASEDDLEEEGENKTVALKNVEFPLTFRKMVPPAVVDCKTKPLYPLASLTKDPNWKGGLIPLPRDYTDLMNLAARFVCNNSVTGESKTPTLCLICGLLVCSQSHCCETKLDGIKCNGCTHHARVCAADTGVYLRIRECIIILQNKLTRGTFLPAPYLDEYGEADKGLKRGNPLYLDTDKYQELNRMWMRNEVPEKIARMFDPEILILLEWNTL